MDRRSFLAWLAAAIVAAVTLRRIPPRPEPKAVLVTDGDLTRIMREFYSADLPLDPFGDRLPLRDFYGPGWTWGGEQVRWSARV